MTMYDYVIVGAGIFGSVFAREATDAGKTCLIIDKRDHIAGNCYTSSCLTDSGEAIHAHMYGPHIFHTNNERIWNYVNKFCKFNNFVNRPKVNYKNSIYSFPINLFTLYQLWGVKTPGEAKLFLESKKIKISTPSNLEEWILSQVGEEIYEKFIKGYTTKQWGRTPDKLPSFIIKRLPIRLNFDDNYFEDIYMSLWNAEINDWDSVTNALKWNTKGFDALTYVSNDGKYALMTINNESMDKATTSSSDIFELSLSASTGKWGSPKAIDNKSINSSYYDGSATMTADRKTMYFVSDRKGDKKSTDIYRVQKDGSTWGKAEALSDYINTTGRETTPYITPDGKFLFFSSDGLPGMGGLDIYVSELKGGVFGQPVNLGSLVNSFTDDTHFSYYPEFKKGYVASVTTSGEKANYDLYEIDLSEFSLPIK